MQALTLVSNILIAVTTIFVISMFFVSIENTFLRKNWVKLSVATYVISILLLQIGINGYLGIVNFGVKFLLLLLLLWIIPLGKERAFEVCIAFLTISIILNVLGLSLIYNLIFEFSLALTLWCIVVFVLPKK